MEWMKPRCWSSLFLSPWKEKQRSGFILSRVKLDPIGTCCEKEFLEKFYLPQKTDKLRREISCIVQRDGETLYEYWERFKKFLEACPHHRIDELVLISYICQRIHHQDKLLLDSVSGGSLTKNKTTAEAWEVILDLADST
ncbi:hypothetical protein AHAS_Ahas02G0165200 [Arachis hypogaea]